MPSCSFDCNSDISRHGSGANGYDARYLEGSRCVDEAQNWQNHVLNPDDPHQFMYERYMAA